MKLESMLTKQVIFDGLRYLLAGKMRMNNGHIPPKNHTVPMDFIGVCVASNDNPATDAYVIAAVQALGIKNVRLDFTYGDIGGDLTVLKCQFLEKLLNANLQVCLHLVQPFEAAQNMQNVDAQHTWQVFLDEVLNRFGGRIHYVEVGTTLNRKNWAGYNTQGFYAAWQIVHASCQAHQVKLAGPNVQDFEPFYNVSLLNNLAKKNQLPNLHSNNLFTERTVEPERFDIRVFKYQWTRFFKINLIKKARLLQKIGVDFGASQLVSPVAFWSIYRIARQLPDAHQKQADYVARYFVLLAASGALRQANWGALICAREGLIDNRLTDDDYPALEQVTFYVKAQGQLKHYQHNPSFAAFKTVAAMIQGAQYLAPIATAAGLEIHAFQHVDKTVHIAWTINGKIAFLQDIYDAQTLAQATIIHRDGHAINTHQTHITETPIYLVWANDVQIQCLAKPKLPQDLAIHQHVVGLQYFRFNKMGWDGLILAKNQLEADLIAEKLNPETLSPPAKNNALRHARNAIWAVADPRDETKQLTIKQPVKMYPHKAWLDRFKPSKAKRSWNGVMHLMRRGISTAMPVAYFEKVNDTSCKQNFYVCEFVPAQANVGQLFAAFTQGETHWQGLNKSQILPQVAEFCLNLHQHLIWFRDLSGGNILVNLVDGKLQFSLIDTARLRNLMYTPFPRQYRLNDMARVCHKLNWADRNTLMQHYFAPINSQLGLRDKLAFQLYTIKVSLKRTIGRKGIKRLIKRFKNQ